MSPDVHIHTMTGAYAVNALDDIERVRFEQHLEKCQACTDEVRELRETTARLAMGVAQRPSPDLAARVLAEVAMTRQLPPVTFAPQTRRRAARRGWLPRVVNGVAACLLFGVAGLSVLAYEQHEKLEAQERTNAAIIGVMSAPDAEPKVAKSGAAVGRVMASRSRGQAVFLSSGLAPTSTDKDYQLWFIGPNGAQSVGVIRPGADGKAAPVLTTIPAGAQKMGMTVEPRNGSRQPTTDPFMVLDLPT